MVATSFSSKILRDAQNEKGEWLVICLEVLQLLSNLSVAGSPNP